MRLTRHAKNRLRWVARRHPEVTADAVFAALPDAETVRYDDVGNRRARIRVGITSLTVVIDDESATVITLWVE